MGELGAKLWPAGGEGMKEGARGRGRGQQFKWSVHYPHARSQSMRSILQNRRLAAQCHNMYIVRIKLLDTTQERIQKEHIGFLRQALFSFFRSSYVRQWFLLGTLSALSS